MRNTIRFIAASAALMATTGLAAWTDHALIGYVALRNMKETQGSVAAETLDSFIAKEAQGLVAVLEEEENWARANVQAYPPRPDSLKFTGTENPTELRSKFMQAIRINPDAHTDLYLQPAPASDLKGKRIIGWEKISILKRNHVMFPFVSVAKGENILIADLVATACDEPDYGLDIGLWEDNNTQWGKTYGYGPIPFGNPKLEYNSQSPFHLGFYHEAWIVYVAAPFLKRTFSQARIHMYLTLARYAFKTGHPYWGWRFTGWGLHYIQDLAQPYHSRVLPSTSTIGMLWINFLKMIGFGGQVQDAIEHVTNTHILIEKIAYQLLREVLLKKEANPIVDAIGEMSRDSQYPQYNESYVMNIVSEEAWDRAGETDEEIEDTLPPEVVDDPQLPVRDSDPTFNIMETIAKIPKEEREELDVMLEKTLASAGVHTRNYIRAAVGK